MTGAAGGPLRRGRAPSSVGAAFRHHWRAGLGALCACLALAAAASLLQPPAYRASLRLAVRAQSGGAVDPDASDVLAQQYADLATSPEVAAGACARLAGQAPCAAGSVAGQLSVTVLPGDAIQLTATAATPQAAAALAVATARSLAALGQARAGRALEEQVRAEQARLARLAAQVAADRAAIVPLTTPDPLGPASPRTAHLAQLQARYDAAYQALQDLQGRQSRLRAELTVLRPAQPPARPVEPDPARYLGVGLAGGLTAGALLALLMERWHRRLLDGRELAEAAGLELVIAERPEPRPVRAGRYGRGWASLLSRRPDARRVLLVAAGERDSAGAAAVALAEAAAGAGQPARVLEAGPGGAPDPAAVEGAVARRKVPARELAAALESRRAPGEDLLVLAAPSPLGSPLAALAGARADLVLLVATRAATPTWEARRAAALLRRAGVEPAAGILVACPPRGG